MKVSSCENSHNIATLLFIYPFTFFSLLLPLFVSFCHSFTRICSFCLTAPYTVLFLPLKHFSVLTPFLILVFFLSSFNPTLMPFILSFLVHPLLPLSCLYFTAFFHFFPFFISFSYHCSPIHPLSLPSIFPFFMPSLFFSLLNLFFLFHPHILSFSLFIIYNIDPDSFFLTCIPYILLCFLFSFPCSFSLYHPSGFLSVIFHFIPLCFFFLQASVHSLLFDSLIFLIPTYFFPLPYILTLT